MSNQRGASVGDYRAPLFLAWQLTNRCQAHCLTCCEESGPENAWKDELAEDEAVSFACRIVESGIQYAAFGGGEPLAVPHFWKIARILASGGVELKLETNGLPIDDEKADILQALKVLCVQISVDGASKETFEKVRPGGDYDGVIAAIKRLVARGLHPEYVFVPNRLNVHEAAAAYDHAVDLGCRTFVTGPMMRLGRAAAGWDELSLNDEQWKAAEEALREREAAHRKAVKLSIYPWDIRTELEKRLLEPQALLLVVPNGKVKLLNALPFAPADVRQHNIEEAWRLYKEAWKSDEVEHFIKACRTRPELLLHANETWPMGQWAALNPA
ncbi:MAG: radical SAM protein [Elusimicrobiota bacterium]